MRFRSLRSPSQERTRGTLRRPTIAAPASLRTVAARSTSTSNLRLREYGRPRLASRTTAAQVRKALRSRGRGPRKFLLQRPPPVSSRARLALAELEAHFVAGLESQRLVEVAAIVTGV